MNESLAVPPVGGAEASVDTMASIFAARSSYRGHDDRDENSGRLHTYSTMSWSMLLSHEVDEARWGPGAWKRLTRSKESNRSQQCGGIQYSD